MPEEQLRRNRGYGQSTTRWRCGRGAQGQGARWRGRAATVAQHPGEG